MKFAILDYRHKYEVFLDLDFRSTERITLTSWSQVVTSGTSFGRQRGHSPLNLYEHLKKYLLCIRLSDTRGVQYDHWVMLKCIMVKAEGNDIHIKYVKSR